MNYFSKRKAARMSERVFSMLSHAHARTYCYYIIVQIVMIYFWLFGCFVLFFSLVFVVVVVIAIAFMCFLCAS